MAGQENPYAGPTSDADGWRLDLSRAGVSIRGVGGYVAAGYSSDRQLAQGFIVGASICSVLVFTRLVSGNASFSVQDVLMLSFVVVDALGGALRARKMVISYR